nr:putative retrotransposon protein [Tanacetum cinerariifolium]
NVHIYKARLVAKGYTQTPGIDYEETFSLVADIRAIRILIAIAVYYDYEIWQMDVKTAFFNVYLNEEEKLKLSKSQGASTPAEMKRIQNVPYALAVGFIMYAVRCTRPDVVFAQNVTSRFQQNPGDIHWTTVKNILKLLMNTTDMFLVYGGDLKRELRVSCYTDAGYLTDADDIKSQTGYVFVLNGGAVDWKSAKQSIFATSSAEAEYIAAFDASKEAVWVRKFISGLGVVPTIEEPISMYCDNTGAIAIANESGITKGARHFRAKVHYIREVIEFGDIKLEKVHTDDIMLPLLLEELFLFPVCTRMVLLIASLIMQFKFLGITWFIFVLVDLFSKGHKHEVFETFKVFQKEVENQLRKIIKSLRSYHGGEYMSQEFLDHLKDHGIIAHRTPPYTSQHNGVSERRNRTLLDMVRSMMSQTTLPKSFGDYALKTAARILNMVPTKKVEKTPYEVWHGKAPKFSYLEVWGYLESEKWLNAMNVEMQSMKDNEEKLKLSKSQGAFTPAKMKRMQNVPYTSAVGSIMKRYGLGNSFLD